MGCAGGKSLIKDGIAIPTDKAEITRSKLLLRFQTEENVYNIKLIVPAQEGKIQG